jgi:opacity protein-like surface antigen
MTRIKITLLVTALIILASPIMAQAANAGLGVMWHDGEIGAQIRKDFQLGGDISQLTGQFGLIFDNTIWALDLDYHWVISTDSGTSRFYPLAGLDFKFTSDHAKFGFNLGGGINFNLTQNLAVFAEMKYVFSDWDGLGIAAGFYF